MASIVCKKTLLGGARGALAQVKLTGCFLGVLLLVTLLGACAGGPDSSTAVVVGTIAPVVPRPGIIDRDELTAVFYTDGVEFDPRKSFIASDAQLFTGLYEGLFSYHPYTMEPVPAMASRWTVSEDKMVWTFTLRDDARYWNGDPVSAQDFRNAWLSSLEPVRQAPYSSLFDLIAGAKDFRLGITQDPSLVGIEARNNNTLVVTLADPASFFPYLLCHHSFSPVHSSLLDTDDWSGAEIVSNGPFYLEERRDNALILAKNPYYWDAASVALNRIVYRISGDPDEASGLWNSGEARWLTGGFFNYDSLLSQNDVVANTLFATHYYFIRSVKAPLKDYRVRRAMSLALPWEEIRGAYALPAETLVYPLRGYPQLDGTAAPDLAEARKLLSEAGYEGGKGIPELVIRIPLTQDAQRIAGLMAGAWTKDLGLLVKVEVIPSGQYFSLLKGDEYDVGLTTWIGDFADPYSFLQNWRRDSNLNDARFDDPDFEALMDKSMKEEGTARWKTLGEAEQLLLDRGTVLPMAYDYALNVVDTEELDGWYPNALDIHPFKYLAFKAWKPLPGVVMANPDPFRKFEHS
ncbi:MAG: peptide ABC transporter substrate-binding protein [Treponema sp.]|nr:peptide ABC transporter substrate-binding protein [Treponema sp.]